MTLEELITLARGFEIQGERDFEIFCDLVKEWPDDYGDIMRYIQGDTGTPIYEGGVADYYDIAIAEVVFGGFRDIDLFDDDDED